MVKYCYDRYKIQEMSDKAVDAYMLPLKFVSDWFVTNKMLEKLDGAVFSTDDIVFPDIDPNIVTFLPILWTLTIYILVILNLMMMIILMIVILQLHPRLMAW